VFVSAAIGRGASHRITESWLSGSADFDVVMCPKLLGEIREVLTTRPRLRKWIGLDNATLFVDTIDASSFAGRHTRAVPDQSTRGGKFRTHS
jgi:hypothetical protein